MTVLRFAVLFCLLCFSALSLSACFVIKPLPPPEKDRPVYTPGSTMYVQTASTGRLMTRMQGAELVRTLVLYDVAPDTTWFTNRPVRKAGSVTTAFFSQEMYMPASDPVNIALTYSSSKASRQPDKTITLQVYDAEYDEASRTLTYSWRPLGSTVAAAAADVGNAAAEPATIRPRPPSGGGSGPFVHDMLLVKPSLMIDDCPSHVPFFCCSGPNCNMAQNQASNGLCYSSPGTGRAAFYENHKNDFNQYTCPTNVVGTVKSSACWDKGHGCVACSSQDVTQACNQQYGSACGNGGCSNSWVPAYWSNFINVQGYSCAGNFESCNGTPVGDAAICPGADPPGKKIDPCETTYSCHWCPKLDVGSK